MAATYDPSLDSGKVRLLSQDTDLDNVIFNDGEIQAFLDLNVGDVRLAAAQALDVIAANEVYVQKRLKLLDLVTDGVQEAMQLRAQASELRRQVAEGSGDFTGMFDFAEQVLDEFSERERLMKELLREMPAQ